jgi:polyferredoxin
MNENPNRFPRPEFESGYQYPVHHFTTPNETFWMGVDLFMLLLLMAIVAWCLLKGRRRRPIFWVSLISVGYFGFFRTGCICSIGSIQNVALALVDKTYVLPLAALLFFLLPILFTLLFGRVFCGGVCPFGALQDIVNVKSWRIPRPVAAVLGMLPYFYLIMGLLYAVTRSSFVICRFDPFISFFRLGGDVGMILFGSLLLLASVFIGRPFCRFLCPYGALLGLFARVSVWRAKITPQCINCDLCHNACPVDAIRPPYDNKVKEDRLRGAKRVAAYLVFLPVMVLAGALLLRQVSGRLSRLHKDVRLYEMVQAWEKNPVGVQPIDVEVFYEQEGTLKDLAKRVAVVHADFRFYSTVAGAFLGLVVGLTLINLTLKRRRDTYEINEAACVACGRCFNYCPQNRAKSIQS